MEPPTTSHAQAAYFRSLSASFRAFSKLVDPILHFGTKTIFRLGYDLLSQKNEAIAASQLNHRFAVGNLLRHASRHCLLYNCGGRIACLDRP